MNSILVVCEGNICRSPMAEGLLRAALPAARVSSAGLGALIGQPADEMAVQLLKERGLDISDHRAAQLTRQMCLNADLVLVMDQIQRMRVEEMYPQVHGRVFKIGEFTSQDVPDPYRQPDKAFRDALFHIEEGIKEWLRRIERL
ncbi:low molecular weight protein-tyrosine-phosphatase [Ramlibacter sp.]|uniref:low molecular weight protein-tyrosine-phosphatase n=1 Tax=Ramlibacter sp. TaxID=1917967 RepID=UPI00260243DB|nr:low molecular weight protein-tyrosine-phosphatase [Ramlibacter sp.]MDB5957090.1 low molecular weight phosphotyrosine protein phosphatase [Ramlibacter sp.]